MDEKLASSVRNESISSPVIHVRASPSHTSLSLSSKSPVTFSVEFTLLSSRPATIFVLDTPLQPGPSDYSRIHRTFDFTNTTTGSKYRPAGIDCALDIIPYREYEVSYLSAHNFITLYPNTPYVVDRHLRPRPRPDQEIYGWEPTPMEAGFSYRMSIPDCASKENLWWRWGPKWQILRWRWWPFGEVKSVDEFVSDPKVRERLSKVEFVWDGDCIIDVKD